MYASLVESKKPSPSKVPEQHSMTSDERTSDDAVGAESSMHEEAVNNKHCSNHDEFDNNNKHGQSEQDRDEHSVEGHAFPSLSNAKTAKNKKTVKEPSKLLNYVIKKKKEKKTKLKSLFRTASPSNLQTHSDAAITGFTTNERAVSIKRHSPSLPCNGKSKKRKRQRGALAVFVAMNKSAGGKINNNHGLSKELLLKTKKKRRRKRKNLESQGCQADSTANLDGSRQQSVESEESPVKKSRREEKKR